MFVENMSQMYDKNSWRRCQRSNQKKTRSAHPFEGARYWLGCSRSTRFQASDYWPHLHGYRRCRQMPSGLSWRSCTRGQWSTTTRTEWTRRNTGPSGRSSRKRSPNSWQGSMSTIKDSECTSGLERDVIPSVSVSLIFCLFMPLFSVCPSVSVSRCLCLSVPVCLSVSLSLPPLSLSLSLYLGHTVLVFIIGNYMLVYVTFFGYFILFYFYLYISVQYCHVNVLLFHCSFSVCCTTELQEPVQS